MDCAFGSFVLERAHRSTRGLRAWDAADQYLLDSLGDAQHPMLVLNDGHGALAVPLAATGRGPVWSVVESALAERALLENLERNGLQADLVQRIRPFDPLPEGCATVVMKLPRDAALLDGQLHDLIRDVPPSVPVLAAGMTRHLRSSTYAALEGCLVDVQSSMARRKARVTTGMTPPPGHRSEVAGLWPLRWKEAGVSTVNHAGIFSSEQLDQGTRVFLNHLPDCSVGEGGLVLDLACGNGILGAAFAAQCAAADLVFLDVSHRALASARATWNETHGSRPATFICADGLQGSEVQDAVVPGSAALVLCNPPFHDEGATTDAVAWRLFSDSRRALQPGGQLLVVGNRHLGYPAKLRRLYNEVSVIADTPKFQVVRARSAG